MKSQLKIIEAVAGRKQPRRHRRPIHDFNLKTKPFAIVPFMIAPVRPLETLDNLLLQARVVTDPIENPLIGWWKEYYFYHIPWRGLPDFAAKLKAMAIDADGGEDMSTLKLGANSVPYYGFKGGMGFVEECLEVVVEFDFREEGESYTLDTIDGYPMAKAMVAPRWHDSLKLASGGADDDELPGVDELEELDILPGYSTHYAQWEMMRDLKFTDLTFEDYLRSEGVSVPADEVKTGTPQLDFKPERVRYVREWTYPTNHVDPATGTPSSACSWSIAERADKRRLFKEPGFLFGVTVTRPKLYFGNQKGAAVGQMDLLRHWLPRVTEGHPYIGLDETAFSATDGILQNQAANYWWDLADLFEYGDQFLNYAATVITGHSVGLPDASMNKRFLTDADVTALFKTDGTEYVREDGRVALDILSSLPKEST